MSLAKTLVEQGNQVIFNPFRLEECDSIIFEGVIECERNPYEEEGIDAKNTFRVEIGH